jgi:hypothetical protein
MRPNPEEFKWAQYSLVLFAVTLPIILSLILWI